MVLNKYYTVKEDNSSPSYYLKVLVEGKLIDTVDFLIEKVSVSGNTVEKTYYENNTGNESLSVAWSQRTSKTYIEKERFKGEM